MSDVKKIVRDVKDTFSELILTYVLWNININIEAHHTYGSRSSKGLW